MKKIITIGLISALSTFLLVGCSSSTPDPEGHTLELGSTAENGRHVCKYSQKDIYKMIKAAGEKDGWKMTEYKSNAFIAEKIDGDNSESVTVTFHGHSLDIEPENDDLKDVLSEALSHENDSH